MIGCVDKIVKRLEAKQEEHVLLFKPLIVNAVMYSQYYQKTLLNMIISEFKSIF